jgi:hypothetical protein
MDENISACLKAQPHVPAPDLEHSDLDEVSEVVYASDDHSLIVLP